MTDWNVRIGSIAMALLLPLAAFAEAPQDFSGEWVVAGKDQSAQDGSSSSQGPGSPHGGHGGGMGGMGGGHGMGGSGHGMGGGGRHHADSSADSASPGGGTNMSMRAVDPRLSAKALTIRQSDVVFDVAADGGKRMVYRFDNRNNYGPDYGGTVTMTWSAPDLVIETHPDGGGSIEERYTLSADGKQLTQHIHEQRAGSDSAHDFSRVFARNGTQAATSQTLP